MKYFEKVESYKELVTCVKNCDKLSDCNDNSNEKLCKCECCKEINLWSYWQGGIENLDAIILLVGQDWGNLKGHEFASIEKVIQYSNGDSKEKVSYMDGNDSITDIHLCELFKSIGYDITGELNNKDLFFTNFVLCYREGTISGNFKTRWANNCSEYLKELVRIIQPKVIICLGRNTFNSVMRTVGGKIPSGKYLDIVSAHEPSIVKLNGVETAVFPMAHCGALGTNNRNKNQTHTDLLGLQKDDWQEVLKYIN